jgi:hypothetical protein
LGVQRPPSPPAGGEGGQKKSECVSESEHTRDVFLAPALTLTLSFEHPKPSLIQRMRCSDFFIGRVATFLLKKMSFLEELQPGIVLFIVFLSSGNIPGDSLKIIHQIISKGFLDIKTLDPLLVCSHQKTVRLSVLDYCKGRIT